MAEKEACKMSIDLTKLHSFPLDEVIYTEAQLCKILGLKKERVGEYRRKRGLPFLKVSDTQRFYLGADVMDWLYSKRMVINADE
jgi:hypothetical protein